MIEVVFDIETKGLFGDNGASEPAHLGVSIVSAYRREIDKSGNEIKGEMKSFWDPGAKNIDGGELGFEWFEIRHKMSGLFLLRIV